MAARAALLCINATTDGCPTPATLLHATRAAGFPWRVAELPTEVRSLTRLSF